MTADRIDEEVTVRGTLVVAANGAALTGGLVLLIQCPSATECANQTVIETGVSSPDGVVSISVPSRFLNLAYYMLRFAGSGNYATADSLIVLVPSPTE